MKFGIRQAIFLLFVSTIPLRLSADIDAQIEAIRHAPIKERFKLMNALKETLIHMKEKERMHAIVQLKAINKSKYGKNVSEELKTKMRHQSHISNEVENEMEHHLEETVETTLGNNNNDTQ